MVELVVLSECNCCIILSISASTSSAVSRSSWLSDSQQAGFSAPCYYGPATPTCA